MYTTNNLTEVLNRTIVKDFPIDYDILYSIMYQQSPTYDLKSQIEKSKFLIRLFEDYTGVKGYTDKLENIYFVKGESKLYPTIVAHYDTAQDYHPGLSIQRAGDWIYGFDVTTGAQCGIGADDSVGIYFALEMLRLMPACKVVLFYGEERGCLGSSVCDMDFFKDSTLVSQLDRRSFKNDFIVHTNGVTVFPDEHLPVIQSILTKYGYSDANGSCTDVGALRKAKLEVASHNTACGYFNEHTNEEIIHIPSMINSMSMVYEIQLQLFNDQVQLTYPYISYIPSNLNYSRNTFASPEYYGWNNMENTDEVVPNSDEIFEMISTEWNYFKEEIDDDLILELTDITKAEATEENCMKNTRVYGLPYVMYNKKSFSSIRGQFMNIRKGDIKRLLLTQGDNNRIGVHRCCTTNMVYEVELDYMHCPECESQYYYPFEPEDMLDLPDDSRESIKRIVEIFI